MVRATAPHLGNIAKSVQEAAGVTTHGVWWSRAWRCTVLYQQSRGMHTQSIAEPGHFNTKLLRAFHKATALGVLWFRNISASFCFPSLIVAEKSLRG